VLALDGSEASKKAIPVATELTRQNGARMLIAHVEEDVVGKGGGPVVATEDETILARVTASPCDCVHHTAPADVTGRRFPVVVLDP
jgi:nucleotide-binding universal stress UspA family protein